MKKKKAAKTEISDTMRENVIEFWETNNNNTIPEIMKKFNLKESAAQSIIRRYFKERFGN